MAKGTKKTASPGEEKNRQRFKMLISIPGFQADVKKIRRALGIPPDAFTKESEYAEWYKKWTGSTLDEPSYWVTDPDPATKYVMALGMKYKLPQSFYLRGVPHTGLFPYLALNKVCPPKHNWSIEADSLPGFMNEISIKTFAPLTKEEMTEVRRALAESYKNREFAKEAFAMSKRRRNTDRDIELDELFSKRISKPVKRKKFSGYLEILKKQNAGISEKQMRRLERERKFEIDTSFDQDTSRILGKKRGMKSGAVRKARARMKKAKREMFGT